MRQVLHWPQLGKDSKSKMKKQQHMLQFTNLSQFDSLIHGFSTRHFGSMRPSDDTYDTSLQTFAATLALTKQQIVRMDQVHGDSVAVVTKKERGTICGKTDGLITHDTAVFLGVITADCVPLFLYDPQNTIVAAIHAGWRGLFSEILSKTIAKMVDLGSKPADIIVGIGPCIGSCCYTIASEHREILLAQFPEWHLFIHEREGKFFLDLSGVAKQQLQSLGIANNHIEDADYCTFDHDDVYSYRREGKDFGEMIGIIGLT